MPVRFVGDEFVPDKTNSVILLNELFGEVELDFTCFKYHRAKTFKITDAF